MCHLVFRAELVGGNMSSCYCSITECTKRQCKGMSKWIKKKFRSNPSNMCFALNLIYLFRNIINLYYISPFYTCQPVHSVKEQLFHYIVLCFIKLQILARIFSFSLLRSQYNFCSGLRTWKFWQILLILLNITLQKIHAISYFHNWITIPMY